MSEPSVERWRRYGHDRLYVQTAGGQRLGHCDLKTGAVVLEPGADRAALDAALAAHHATNAPAGDRLAPVALADRDPAALPGSRAPLDDRIPAGGGPGQPPTPLPAGEAAWVDLAGNRPGAAARAQAVTLRRAAPVRTFFGRLFGVRTEERSWRIGADGEEAVAAELAGLGSRWQVLHSVPVGEHDSDIDHVVIGPPGVFTVNTKNHPTAAVWVGSGAVRVNGRGTDYVRNSSFEARRATKLLTAATGAHPGPVVGVIAVVGARRGLTITNQPKGVHVTTRRDIRSWLERQPDKLTDAQVHALHEAARRSTTWRTA